MATLFDYAENAPNATFNKMIRHPESHDSVIGMVGFDHSRAEPAAVFFRKRATHYFRKYAGYAISETVLTNCKTMGVSTIYIVEEDAKHHVIEFDAADFHTGTPIAYSPEQDTMVEGAMIEHADSLSFNDRQRVAAEDSARADWQKDEVTFNHD